MRKKIVILASIAAGFMAACGGGGSDEPYIPEKPEVPDKPDGPDNPDKPVEKHPVKPAFAMSEGAFAAESKVGLYMVNYHGDNPGSLKEHGNFMDNASFTYHNNEWTSNQTYYWDEDVQKADFFAYYPYKTISDATKCPLQVSTDQQSSELVNASAFLWGKATGSVSANNVSLTLNQLMSKVVITLEPAGDLTQEELLDATVSVQLCKFLTQAAIHLGTGKITPGDKREDILPYHYKDLSYQAVILPQTFQSTQWINVKVNDKMFTTQADVTFEAGKQQDVTIKITRNTINVDVSKKDWEIVDGDFGDQMKPDFE